MKKIITFIIYILGIFTAICFFSPADVALMSQPENILFNLYGTKLIGQELDKNADYEMNGNVNILRKDKEDILLRGWYGKKDKQFFLSPDKKTLIYIDLNVYAKGNTIVAIDMPTGKVVQLDNEIQQEINPSAGDSGALTVFFSNILFNQSGNKFTADIGFEAPQGYFCLFNVNKFKAGDTKFYSCYDSYNTKLNKCYLKKCYVFEQEPYLGTEVYYSNMIWKDNNTISFVSKKWDSEIVNFYELDSTTGNVKLVDIYPPSPFLDLKPVDPDYALILKWQKEGWLKGDANGKINLDKIMTRKDMMEFSYLINIPAIPEDAVWPCSDLDVKDPLAPLFFQGFKDGLQLVDGNECAPEESVTRLEVVSMIFSGFEYEPAKIDCQDRWPDYNDPMLPNAPYAALAKSNNLFGKDAVKLEPNKTMTKREAIKLDQLVVDESIGDYNNPHVIPCDIDKYAKEYTWNPDSAVSKLLFRRKLMKWGAIGLGGALGLGGIVYGVMRRRKKGKK